MTQASIASNERSALRNALWQTANFMAGGIAGTTAWVFVHPLDLAKTRLQLVGDTAGSVKQSIPKMIGHIIKTEGPLGLFGGLSPALLRMATYTTLRQGMYPVFKNAATSMLGTEKLSFWAMMGCGLASGAFASSTTVPVDVCLVRMQADGRLPPEKRRNYKHVFDALRRIAKEEGILTYWRGATPTIYRAMALNASQLSTYDQAKTSLQKNFGMDGLPLHFSASLVAGFISSGCALPFDIAKTRMQNQLTVPGQPLKYRNMLQSLVHIVKNEGLFALWAGFTPFYVRTGLHVILLFVFMEQIKQQLQAVK